MFRSLNIIFSTVGCIIGWGAFIAPENMFLPKLGIENSLLGITIGAFLTCMVTYAVCEKKIFFLEWFLILGYLCISALNLLNLTTLLDKYFSFHFSINISILINTSIIILCYFLFSINYTILKVIYNISSFLFCLFLVCIEFGIAYLLLFGDFKKNNISFSLINFHSTLEMISISPWLFIGFNYALNQKHKHKIALAIIAILFSSLIYLSITFIVGTSPIGSLWKLVEYFFGSCGLIFLFLTILFSIISGFLGFVLLTIENLPAEIKIRSRYEKYFFILFLLTLLGRDNLDFLITITSLAFALTFVIKAYLFAKKTKTFLSCFPLHSSIFIFLSSFLPQNRSLYNKTTITILFLWILFGIFLRYDFKKRN